MWTRQIILLGTSHAVVIPPDVVHAMQWQPRDILVVEVVGPNKVQLSKLYPPRDVELAQAVADLQHEPTTTGAN